MYKSRAVMNNMSMQLAANLALTKAAGCMQKSAEVMGAMNDMMKIGEMTKEMHAMARGEWGLPRPPPPPPLTLQPSPPPPLPTHARHLVLPVAFAFAQHQQQANDLTGSPRHGEIPKRVLWASSAVGAATAAAAAAATAQQRHASHR